MKNYYATLTVVGWIDVFTCKEYTRELIAALKDFQKKANLDLYAWLIMSNQVHLLIRYDHQVEVLLREFKRYSAARLIRQIEKNNDENRSGWLLHMLSYFGKYSRENRNFQFWMEEDVLMEVDGRDGLVKTLDQIMHIPVTEGIVSRPEHYVYSSANARSAIAVPVLKDNTGLIPG
ncbi:MAG TPA: transposase [Bacteroidia bacterium]|jgi:REP element-mobilizing transposase RayT|nr:transposase [Bacteroidia bacterium]